MPDEFGRRPLAHACDQSRVEVVQFLLLHTGVDANPSYVSGERERERERV
jgi:hypothetical protein